MGHVEQRRLEKIADADNAATAGSYIEVELST
jgi:hypothetical protein